MKKILIATAALSIMCGTAFAQGGGGGGSPAAATGQGASSSPNSANPGATQNDPKMREGSGSMSKEGTSSKDDMKKDSMTKDGMKK